MTNIKRGLAALWLLFLPAAAHAACSSGVTNCATDTISTQGIVIAINDPTTQTRIFNEWNQQCDSVYAEAASVLGHTFRVNMCTAIAAGRLPPTLLVSLVMTSTIVPQVLAGQPSACTAIPLQGGCNPAAGNMVTADVDFAIAAALAVSGGSVSTTGSTFSASTTATQATVGAATLTVASAAGIIPGMFMAANGVPAGAFVVAINGTTITISQPTTAALSTTPIFFYQSNVSQFSVASATGLAPGQSVTGPGIAPGTTVQIVSGTTVTVSPNITNPLSATPLVFTLYTGLPTRAW